MKFLSGKFINYIKAWFFLDLLGKVNFFLCLKDYNRIWQFSQDQIQLLHEQELRIWRNQYNLKLYSIKYRATLLFLKASQGREFFRLHLWFPLLSWKSRKSLYNLNHVDQSLCKMVLLMLDIHTTCKNQYRIFL